MQNNKIGLISCVLLVIGGCIGSAIYSLSGMTIYYAGPSAIISWIIAGVIMGMYGMQVAELASRFPQSGGTFVFPNLAIGEKKGELLGFISAWGYIVSNLIAIAFSAIYVSTYLSAGFEFITNDMQIPLAILVVIVCMVLNLLKITDTGKFYGVFVFALVSTMLIYGIIGIFGGTFNIEYFTPFFSQGLYKNTGFISAIPIAAVAYGACVSIAFMVSEIKNSNKTIPKAMFVGLGVVICLYLFVLVGTIGNLKTDILLDDNNAFYRYVPMFAAYWISGLSKYKFLAPLISISAFFALLTTIMVLMAINARTLLAISKNGHFNKIFVKENKNGIPSVATVTMASAACLLCFRPDFTEMLVKLGALLNVFTTIITCYSLIVARRKKEVAIGEYKAIGGNFVTWLIIVLLILCYIPDIIAGAWQLVIFTILIYLVGFIIYGKL